MREKRKKGPHLPHLTLSGLKRKKKSTAVALVKPKGGDSLEILEKKEKPHRMSAYRKGRKKKAQSLL